MKEQIINNSNENPQNISNLNLVSYRLLNAALEKRWDEVNFLLANKNVEDINFTLPESPHQGKTILWLAADDKQWNIIEKILDSYQDADINASPREGDAEGITALWKIAYNKKWLLVRKILNNYYEADFNASPLKGPYKTIDALQLVVKEGQWDIVRELLDSHPEIDIETAPLEGINKGRTAFWLTAQANNWDIAKLMYAQNPNVNIENYAYDTYLQQTMSIKQLAESNIYNRNNLNKSAITRIRNSRAKYFYDKALHFLLSFENQINSSTHVRDNNTNLNNNITLTDRVHLNKSLANIFALKSQFEMALRFVHKAEELGEKNAPVLKKRIYLSLAKFYCQNNQIKDMTEILTEQLNDLPNTIKGDFYYEIGKFYFIDKNIDESSDQHYRRLLRSIIFLDKAAKILPADYNQKGDIENLLFRVVNIALGNKGLDNSSDNMKDHKNYGKLMEDINTEIRGGLSKTIVWPNNSMTNLEKQPEGISAKRKIPNEVNLNNLKKPKPMASLVSNSLSAVFANENNSKLGKKEESNNFINATKLSK